MVAHHILEIKRGKGTYVIDNHELDKDYGLHEFATFRPDLKDLFEIRLILEPQAAYYAARRASEKEMERILYYGILEEEQIFNKGDRTEIEQAFHKAIAKATHNEFINRLMPILYNAIDMDAIIYQNKEEMVQNTLTDHRIIMDFLVKRDADGARTAMKLHIIHAMRDFGIEE